MPFNHTIQINADTKVGIWKISEPEDYFLKHVSIQKNISHPYKRLQHLAGRRLLKMLEPDFPVDTICVDSSGKPHLPDPVFQFSISHSENYAAAIVSRSNSVGIDVEKINPKLFRIAPKFLNEKERSQMPDNLVTYALCWSAKEAVYKWYGKKKVDFKKHIHLKAFHPQKNGRINCVFTKDKEDVELLLNYRVGEEFVLVWVAG